MPRKRHVSRKDVIHSRYAGTEVMPRKRHVSRKTYQNGKKEIEATSCLARGM